jgi:DNA-3-methyladenine glycosylase II
MHAKALRHLRRADPVLGAVIARVGACPLKPHTEGTHFDYVVRSIVYQQLSGKAAATIYGRVLGLYGGAPPTPAQLVKTAETTLRGVGLSTRKAEYVRDLAIGVRSRALPIDRLHEMTDDEVIETLVSVRGIGRWTAQMVLMFRLGRPDVFPELDLGVQKGVQQLLALRKLPTPEKMTRIAERWAPYRTVAAWYLWRLLDLEEE